MINATYKIIFYKLVTYYIREKQKDVSYFS